jgi:hypothetical protein
MKECSTAAKLFSLVKNELVQSEEYALGSNLQAGLL